MLAPEGFQLPNPVDCANHPPPDLPRYLKHQVYEKPEVFSKVDEHAIQVSMCIITQVRLYVAISYQTSVNFYDVCIFVSIKFFS